MSNMVSARRQREVGIVSIMVTVILMVVISLTVLGFAEVSRTEQRSSLDEHLSVQAFYAAESGINDARSAIATKLAGGLAVPDKGNCAASPDYVTLTGIVDAADSVSYTCVLIYTGLPNLKYTIGNASTVIPLISNGPSFGQLNLTWSQASAYPGVPSSAGCYSVGTALNTWVQATNWPCHYPVVRVDMVDASGAMSRGNWGNTTATMFLVPYNTAGSANVGFSSGEQTVAAPCNNFDGCEIHMIGMSKTTYYMRVTTIYQPDSTLTITTNGAGKAFTGAQAIIDATGKAQDVLRRVRVAVDLTDANAKEIPSAAIVSQDSVCKQFGVISGPATVYTPLAAGADGNPLCTDP